MNLKLKNMNMKYSTPTAGGSTGLMNYIAYIGSWSDSTDKEIEGILNETKLFTNVGAFKSDPAVKEEFDDLVSRAKTIRDLTVAADLIQITADAAAIGAVWSFGIGMGAFVALEVTEAIDKAIISKKAGQLTEKLKSIDTDISSKISPKVDDYIKAYKGNNKTIAEKRTKGMDEIQARTFLLQFTAEIKRYNNQKGKGEITVDQFRNYIAAARKFYNSSEIKKVCDALDDLTLSEKKDIDLDEFSKRMKDIVSHIDHQIYLSIITVSAAYAAMSIVHKGQDLIIRLEENGVIEVGELDGVFNFFKGCEVITAGIAITLAVVDIILEIINIVDVIEQSNQWCYRLNEEIRPKYISYFKSIKTASTAYNAAVASKIVEKDPDLSGKVIYKGTISEWMTQERYMPVADHVDSAFVYNNAHVFFLRGSGHIRVAKHREYLLPGHDKQMAKIYEIDADYLRLRRCFRGGKWASNYPWSTVDASLYYPPTNRLYLFKGIEFVACTINLGPNNAYGRELEFNVVGDIDYPVKTAEHWNGWPAKGFEKIDATLFYERKAYFFSGDQYICCTLGDNEGVDDGYPKPIVGNWPGLEVSHFPLSAAICGERAPNWEGTSMYTFFSGENYITFEPDS
jgi:hypothetical protein